ncbi:rho GTPase-activating protein 18 [Ixodes scapularis]|uniref:rho GTPase-activating protein 18 n=1 Tax=Ixodes scapularis TaxID=6945 RepID=UPI001A9E0D70|nr:rho GTPase-activating protein 18 [Ixodes scapularis]
MSEASRSSPGGAEASRHFDDYWSEYEHFRVDDDEDEDRPPPEEEQDADWLREVGLDFVLRDEGGESGAQTCPDLLRVPYLRTLSREQAAAVQKRLDTVTLRRKKHPPKLDVREVFGRPSWIQQAEDGPDGLGGRAQWRVPAAHQPSVPRPAVYPRQPSSSLWKTHRHQYELKSTDAVATPDAEGVAVIGYRMKGTVRHIPEPAYRDVEEEPDECPVPSLIDWTLQPGFSESYALEHPDQELPLVTLSANPAGVAVLGHLSPADQRKVRNLALIELTAMYDALAVSFTRRKNTRRKTKESLLCGASLATLLEQDAHRHVRADHHQVPLVLREILDFLRRHGLREEGILRVSGSAVKMDALRAELEACYSKSPELLASVLDRYGVHEVAGLLKQILRHLPEPLLTNKYADAFVQVARVPTLLLQLKALNLLVLVLPEPNRDTLLALVHFLADVAEMAPRNRMSLHNVAMVLAPNLFSPKRRKATEENLHVARTTTTLTRMLVWYRQILWTIPSQLLSQVRMAYRMELDKKQLKENKKKKRKERPSWFAARDAGDADVVRVRVEHDSEQAATYPVKLSDATTAGSVVGELFLAMHFEARKKDIVNAGRPSSEQSRAHPDDTLATFLQHHWLYEVGGYIGWRRLEHGTNVAAVCRENPLADWTVRCHHPQGPAGVRHREPSSDP